MDRFNRDTRGIPRSFSCDLSSFQKLESFRVIRHFSSCHVSVKRDLVRDWTWSFGKSFGKCRLKRDRVCNHSSHWQTHMYFDQYYLLAHELSRRHIHTYMYSLARRTLSLTMRSLAQASHARHGETKFVAFGDLESV